MCYLVLTYEEKTQENAALFEHGGGDGGGNGGSSTGGGVVVVVVEAVFGLGTWCFVPMKNTILYSGQSLSHQWERTVTMDSFYSMIPVRTSKSPFSLDQQEIY